MELMPLCKGPRKLSSSLLSVMERYNQKTGIGKPKIRPSSDSNSTYKSILDFLGSRSVRDKVLSFKPSSLGKSVAAARAKNYPGTNHVWQKRSLLTVLLNLWPSDGVGRCEHSAPGHVCHESPVLGSQDWLESQRTVHQRPFPSLGLLFSPKLKI